jgi:hypothetical protein
MAQCVVKHGDFRHCTPRIPATAVGGLGFPRILEAASFSGRDAMAQLLLLGTSKSLTAIYFTSLFSGCIFCWELQEDCAGLPVEMRLPS